MFLQWANFIRELFPACKSLLSDVPLTPMTLSLTPIWSHTSLISTVMLRWKWQAPEQNMELCHCISMVAHYGCAPPRRVALDTNLIFLFIYYRTIESTAVTFSHTETTSFSHPFYSHRSQQFTDQLKEADVTRESLLSLYFPCSKRVVYCLNEPISDWRRCKRQPTKPSAAFGERRPLTTRHRCQLGTLY